jgi:2-polyprenyl-3-methyl-5-hydroxy-6-metoxy-1,4-benzoquinol methylase
MARLRLEPDPKWEAFAAREPFFAILTTPRFRRDSLTPEREREFFASGEHLVEWMFGVIEGVSPQFAPASMLEYGCGIGRLALPLARRPGSVTAVDRSPVMRQMAREHADRHGLGHIEFQDAASLFQNARRFDLVVCYHVLQRLRRREAMTLANLLAERVGPGGIGIFQWALREGHSASVRTSRWLRERVPLVNGLANRLLGKSTEEPFVPTQTVDLPDAVSVFDLRRFRVAHVALERHGTLDYAVVVAQRRETDGAVASTRRSPPRIEVPTTAPATVSDADLARFNRAAEAYFATLPTWDHHLEKPFSNADESPVLLANVAVLFQALRLTPGLRVLDFGGGSGWLSHWMTRLGCEVVLLDVAPTALEMAQALYRRQPPPDGRPAPEFLRFDGRRIDLPDASVDRVVCFDAFHHAPNPDDIIREFGRILRPGGMAGFVEPGPRHAEAPRSRFESQTYGVVERDVDVHALWRTARECGFTDMKLSVFHAPPHHVSLREYEDLLAGGRAQDAWLAATRLFLRSVRSFVLIRSGEGPHTSRTTDGLASEIRVSAAAVRASAGAPIVLEAEVTNQGSATWLPGRSGRGGVSLGTHLYDATGALVAFDHVCEPLTTPPRDVCPGETVRCRLTVPGLDPGRYRVEIDCVADQVAWFAQAGSRPAVVTIEVMPVP